MKKTALLSLCLIVLLANQSSGQNFNHIETTIDSLITNHMLPSLAVGILKDGEIIYEKAFGYSDLEGEVKTTIHTPYQLASLSKPITATVIMKLHSEGIIDMYEPITKYVPLKKVDPTFQDPSIKQVLNHTAGLGTYFDMYYEDENTIPTSFTEAWDKYGIQFHEPGKVCEYSNIGYGLLSHIISKVTSGSFAQHLQKHILPKLRMHNTFVMEQPTDKDERVAKKYDHKLNPLPFIWNNTIGAGNIAASIHDLMQFASLHLQSHYEGFLEAPAIHNMQVYQEKGTLFHYYQDTYYGLGWYIMPDDNGKKVVWHEGGMIGASTILKLYPNQNIAIALLTNTHNPKACRLLSDIIVAELIDNYQPTPINEIAAYESTYTDTTFWGKWAGTMRINQKEIPIIITIDDQTIDFNYMDQGYQSFLTDYQPLPVHNRLLFGAVHKDYFIGTGTGELPASDKRKNLQHLFSFKLFKEGTTMTGTIVHLAAAQRQYYGRPYAIQLKKTIPDNR